MTYLLLFWCLFLEGAVEYLVLMVETRALNISWWSSQHQRVPPSGVNPAFFSFSISEGHLGSTMSAQSSQADALQKGIPWGCFAFSPVRKKAAPKKPTFCIFVWLLHIQLINPTENQGLCLSSWRISHHFIIARGGGALEDFGGGITMFSGEKRWKSDVANRTSWKTFENWLQMRGNH